MKVADLQLKDVLAVGISFVALVVALYGIIERYRVQTRAERVRLSEIISSIPEIDRLESAADPEDRALAQSYNASREVLCQQALGLLRRFRTRRRLLQRFRRTGDVTAVEYRLVAIALGRSGYPENAEETWRSALARARDEGPVQTLFILRGLAFFLFDREQLDEARGLLREASALLPGSGYFSLQNRVSTYLWWAEYELREAHDLARAAELLDLTRGLIAQAETPGSKVALQGLIDESDVPSRIHEARGPS